MYGLSRELIKDYLILIIIGLATGIAVSIFYIAFEGLWWITNLLISYNQLLSIFTVSIGILLSYLVVDLFARVKKTGCGTHGVLVSYLTHNGYIHHRDTISKTVASILTMGFGGSAGPEGPSMLLGGGIASLISRKFNVSIPKLRRFFIAGSAAGISAVFRAPLTGILFALELPYRRDIEGEALIEAIISSVTAYMIFILINGPERLFPITIEFIELSPFQVLNIIFLGILASVVAYIFVETYIRLGKVSKFLMLRIHPFLLAILGGVFIGILSLLDKRILGSGYGLIRLIVNNIVIGAAPLILIILILKVIATSITLNFGGSGGLFIPSIVVGALMSSLYISIFHVEPSVLYIAAGMAAVLAGTSKTPLTAVALVAETCGPATIIPTIIAALVCYIATGNLSFFELQQPHKIAEEDLILDEVYLRIIEVDPNIPRKIKVYQAMTTKPISLKINETIEQVLEKVKNYAYRVYPVISDDRTLVGYISLEDILGVDDLSIKINKFIRKAIIVSPNDDLRIVIRKMIEEDTDHVFIVDDKNRLIGIIAEMDIIRTLINELSKLRRKHMKL